MMKTMTTCPRPPRTGAVLEDKRCVVHAFKECIGGS